MSSYNGRRAPNVSQYLADLNVAPSAHDVATPADFNIDDGLDFLTNTEFFDFDSFNEVDGLVGGPPQPPDIPGVIGKGPQYQFGEFQTYPSVNTTPNTVPPSPQIGLVATYPLQPLHPYAPHGPHGDKRSATVASMSSPTDLEDVSRLAADEDKRRRNTAASARFRVKKKQREQALEKQTKDMLDKVQTLEGKVQQLETENKWLRGLLTEKNEGKILDALAGKTTIEKESDERITESRTDGVGTSADGLKPESG